VGVPDEEFEAHSCDVLLRARSYVCKAASIPFIVSSTRESLWLGTAPCVYCLSTYLIPLHVTNFTPP